MTRPIGSAPAHATPASAPRAPSRPSDTTTAVGFAHHLSTHLQPRTPAPTPERPAPAPQARETATARDTETSDETSQRDAPTGTGSRDSREGAAPTSPAATGAATTGTGDARPGETLASIAHGTPSADQGSAAEAEAPLALAGWMAVGTDVPAEARPARPATEGTVGSSRGAATLSDGMRSAPLGRAIGGNAHVPQTAWQPHSRSPRSPASDAEADPTPASDHAATDTGGSSTGETAHEGTALPPGVSVLAVASRSVPADGSPAANAHDASTAPDASMETAVAAAMAAASAAAANGTSTDGGAPDGATDIAAGLAAPGPDVTGALATDAAPPVTSDRITLQLGTDQGAARIQIAVSNGAIATRIVMPDATTASHLAAATTELHDALVRQGFDAVKIAVPPPPGAAPSALGHSGESAPDRTPDRAPQQSFTSAHDQRMSGRSQQHPRRQRER